MAGLIGSAGAGVTTSGFRPEEEEAEEQPNVSTEEQAVYDMFVKNGMEMLYPGEGEEKIQPEVLNRLSTGNPKDALAQTAVWLVMMVENSARSSGKEIPDDVVMMGGRELFEQLVEVAEAAKIHTFTDGEMQGAWYAALDMYREANTGEGGRFNPEEASAEFAALAKADKEGRGEEVIPGWDSLPDRAFGKVEKIDEDEEPVAG